MSMVPPPTWTCASGAARGGTPIGADVVETAPDYDHGEITCVAAAPVAFDLVTLMSKTKVPSSLGS